jgi:DNA-binding transcriptional ArsR family regulator
MDVKVDSGLAYEALIALVIVKGNVPPGRFDAGRALKRRFAGLPDKLRRTISSVDAGEGHGWGALLGLVPDAGVPRGMAELITHLESMRPLDLKLAMLGYHDRTYRQSVGAQLFRDAAAGSRRAVAKFRRQAARARQGLEVGPLLDLPPREAAQATLEILSALPPELYILDRRAPQVLSRAAAQAAGLTRTLTAEAVVTRLTRGIVAGPLTEALVVPTALHGPWTLVVDHDRTRIFCYPVALGDAAEGEPDPELVALYRALADPTRLRLLKRLAAGRATFGQLSHDLGLARSTLHQHALILRTAGLLRLQLDFGLELNPDRPHLDRRLEEFLSS